MSMRTKLKWTLAAALLALASTGAALASTGATRPGIPYATTVVGKQMPATLPPLDRSGIEDTIRGQLRALATHDAAQAFAKLAPSTQHFFGKPDKFLATMSQDLPPMLATHHFTFLGVEQDQSSTYQQVLITDSDGKDWLARYQLERERNGDWRVKGCVVAAAPGQLA
jgi:Domain of unknown function (DUF4864)